MTLGGAALHLALRACPPLRAVQVPIWKKEVYGASAAKWKENAEAVTSQLSTSKALARASRAIPLASITITMLAAACAAHAMGRRGSMR